MILFGILRVRKSITLIITYSCDIDEIYEN